MAFRVVVWVAVGVAFRVVFIEAFRVAVGAAIGVAVKWRVGVMLELLEWHENKCCLWSCVLKLELELWVE